MALVGSWMLRTPITRWLKILVKSEFCTPIGPECSNHAYKMDMNLFCLECCSPVCPICWDIHSSHTYLQIRRYLHGAVVFVHHLNGRFDCSSVESFTMNGSEVVFIKRDPQAWPTTQDGSKCITCTRCLQHFSFIFCSLYCKVEYLQIETMKLQHGQMNNTTTSSASVSVSLQAVDGMPSASRKRKSRED